MRIHTMEYIHEPALRVSEAALLPAKLAQEVASPLDTVAQPAAPAATQKRRSSMAGRSVLHAEGINLPGYVSTSQKTMRQRRRMYI